MTTKKNTVKSPFDHLPSDDEIAAHFLTTTRKNDGYNGITLYDNGNDYSYLWVDSHVDHDWHQSYLLEVRTKIGVPAGQFGELRDYLFVHISYDGTATVERHNQPVRFDADPADHRRHFRDGHQWFVTRMEKALGM